MNKKEVLMSLSKGAMGLYELSEELRSDKEVVMAAVKKSGVALMYASEDLKGDKEVVITAVSQNAKALYFASQQLQNDKELLLLLEGNKKANEYKTQWYDERMQELAKYREQEILENKINKAVLRMKFKNIKF
jgi:cell division GTPase FtsZ